MNYAEDVDSGPLDLRVNSHSDVGSVSRQVPPRNFESKILENFRKLSVLLSLSRIIFKASVHLSSVTLNLSTQILRVLIKHAFLGK